MTGAKKSGLRGFVKGVGKGLAGAVVKPTLGVSDSVIAVAQVLEKFMPKIDVFDCGHTISTLELSRFLCLNFEATRKIEGSLPFIVVTCRCCLLLSSLFCVAFPAAAVVVVVAVLDLRSPCS